MIVVIWMIMPSKTKGGNSNSNSRNKASNGKGKVKVKVKKLSKTAAAKAAAAKAAADKQAAYTKVQTLAMKKSMKHNCFLPFGRRKKIEEAIAPRHTDPNKLNESLDFLQRQQENDESDKYFKHSKVNDSYKELVKAGPSLSFNLPDLDDIDHIFTVMIGAGAISGKEHLVTNYEHQYLQKLRLWFGDKCHVFCQVSVGSTVKINADVSDLNMVQRRSFAQKCNNMSFDFMLLDRRSERIVCVIELDDPTHQRIERKMRDRRLDKVCKAANINIFHITNINQKPDLTKILREFGY